MTLLKALVSSWQRNKEVVANIFFLLYTFSAYWHLDQDSCFPSIAEQVSKSKENCRVGKVRGKEKD